MSYIILKSPAGYDDKEFIINEKLISADEENENPLLEVIETINWICLDVGNLQSVQEVLRRVDKTDIRAVIRLAEFYNKEIKELQSKWQRPPSFINRRAMPGHLKFILQQCYNSAVIDPERLNAYEPFSPEVYGETSFGLVEQMISALNFTDNDIFIDLGSGVGQVVLQIAASTDTKVSRGIEKATVPAAYSLTMQHEFQRWMAFFGKPYGPFAIEKGDFLEKSYKEQVCASTIIFVNNFAFGPKVDHHLKLLFANLKEGARIVSSKAFCPLNFRITDRNLGDIASIMCVNTLGLVEGAVSWTDSPFEYFIHTIDRSRLEKYFSRLKNPEGRDVSDEPRKDRLGRPIEKTAKVPPQEDEGSSSSSRRRTPANSQSTSRAGSPPLSTEENISSNSSLIDVAVSGPALPMIKCTSHIGGAKARGRKRTKPHRSTVKQRGTRVRAVAFRAVRQLEAKHRLQDDSVTTVASDFTPPSSVHESNSNLSQFHRFTVNSVTEPDFDSSRFNDPLMAACFASTYESPDALSLTAARAATSNIDSRLLQTEQVEPDALDQLVSMIRYGLVEHIRLMHTSEYQQQLRQRVRQETARNKELRTRMRTLQAHVSRLQQEGLRSFRSALQDCGIRAEKPVDFFSAARHLIKRHKELDLRAKDLSLECGTLEAQVLQLQRMAKAVPVQQTAQAVTAAGGSVTVHDYISVELMNQYLQQQQPPAKKPTVTTSLSVAPMSNHHIIKQRLSPAHAAAVAQLTVSGAQTNDSTSTYSPISNAGDDSEPEDSGAKQVNGTSCLPGSHLLKQQQSPAPHCQVDWSAGGKRPRLASLMAGGTGNVDTVPPLSSTTETFHFMHRQAQLH